MLNLKLVPFPQLKTRRLLLRKTDEGDVSLLYSLRMDPVAMEFLDRDKPAGIDEIKDLIDRMETDLHENKGISWCLTFPDEDRLIGIAGFWRTMPEHYRAELGYMLHPDYWGLGYMHEALNCIIKYAFEVMRLHCIEANVNPNNGASIRLLEKLGFEQEPYFKENYYYQGEFLDSVNYILLTSMPQNETGVHSLWTFPARPTIIK